MYGIIPLELVNTCLHTFSSHVLWVSVGAGSSQSLSMMLVVVALAGSGGGGPETREGV